MRDRVLWILIAAMLAVVFIAGLVLALGRESAPAFADYLPDESDPVNVVHNAYVAAYRGDRERFAAYFDADSQTYIIENYDFDFLDFERSRFSVELGSEYESGDSARVNVVMIRKWGDLFGPQAHFDEQSAILQRRDGRWLLTEPLPLISPVYARPVPPATPTPTPAP